MVPKLFLSLTLISIFPFSDSGDGNVVSSSEMTFLHNMSLSMSSKYSAIFVCCGMEQWFSMERITGYLEGGRGERGRGGGGEGEGRGSSNERCTDQSEGLLRGDGKGVFLNGHNDIFEQDLGGECVAMEDGWLAIFSVPAVHCTRNTDHRYAMLYC